MERSVHVWLWFSMEICVNARISTTVRLLCCAGSTGGEGAPNIRPMLERAGLWDLIQVALAQQIIWAPESRTPL